MRIDFASLITDIDGDILTLTYTNPAHGSLTRNTDGSYTYKPTSTYTGADTITYTVSDGKVTTTGTISINVVASYTTGTTATVTVQATTGATSGGPNPVQYVVITSAQTGNTAQYNSTPSTTPVINWTGTTSVLIGGLSQQLWVQGFLGVRTTTEDDLASLTGLKVVV